MDSGTRLQLAELEDALVHRVATGTFHADAFTTGSIRDVMLDTIGVAVAGQSHPPAAIVGSVFDRPPGRCAVLGTSATSSPLAAARVNGVAAHALDFDDSVQPAMSHPSAVLVPSILAVGDLSRPDGARILDAYGNGLLAFHFLGHLMNPAHYEAGWHATAILGRIAGAVAASRLLGLDETGVREALGIATSMAAGARVNFGTMAKSLHAGLAAHDAVAAALLAARGFGATELPLSGRFGFVDLYSGATPPDIAAAANVLTGPKMAPLIGLFIKPYAACGATQTTIHASLILRRQQNVTAESLEHVEVRVNPRVTEIVDHEEPRSGLAAKFNLAHAVAVALLDDRAGIEQFTDEAACREDVAALRRKVTVHPDDAIGATEDWPVVVTAQQAGGRQIAVAVERAPGKWTGDRLSWDQVVSKFNSNLAYAGIPIEAGEPVIACLATLPDGGYVDLHGALIAMGSGGTSKGGGHGIS